MQPGLITPAHRLGGLNDATLTDEVAFLKFVDIFAAVGVEESVGNSLVTADSLKTAFSQICDRVVLIFFEWVRDPDYLYHTLKTI